jgi:hypothetical protein
MAVQISRPFTVMCDSGLSESVGEDGGPTATVKMKCLWDDHYQIIRDLCGVATGSQGNIVREPPFRYPPAPALVAQSIPSIEGLGKPFLSGFFPMDGRWITRKYAVMTVVFGQPKYDYDGAGQFGQPYTTVSFGVSGEHQTMPNSVYRFADGTVTTTPIGRMIPSMQISVTRHMLPYSPLGEIATLMGNINSDPYEIAGHAFAAGTLLFEGGDDNIEVDSVGNVTITVSYKFVFRPIPWNYYLSPKRTTGYALVTDGSGNPVYQSGDFSSLP